MNIKPYLFAIATGLAGCAATQPGHLPAVTKDSTDYQIFRLVRIACIYDGTVKVHKVDTHYEFEGDDRCSPTITSWERVCKEENTKGEDKVTPEDVSNLEDKVFAEYAK